MPLEDQMEVSLFGTRKEENQYVITSSQFKNLIFLVNQPTHKGNVTKLEYFENLGIIVSSGKDKSIKFYELPEYWRDKKIEEEERREA